MHKSSITGKIFYIDREPFFFFFIIIFFLIENMEYDKILSNVKLRIF